MTDQQHPIITLTEYDVCCKGDDFTEVSLWHNSVSAAALRALAVQVVPQPRLPYDSCCDIHAAAIRAEILAIAAELEGGR